MPPDFVPVPPAPMPVQMSYSPTAVSGLKRPLYYRPRNCPVPMLEDVQVDDRSEHPFQMMTASLESNSNMSHRGKSTRTKRPRVDPNFITGEQLEDEDAVDKDAATDELLPKKKKLAKKKVKDVKKGKSSKSKKSGKTGKKMIKKKDGSKDVETGETVIMALKCSEEGCDVMLATRQEFNRHLLYMHSKYPYACLAAQCQKEFQIM